MIDVKNIANTTIINPNVNLLYSNEELIKLKVSLLTEEC